MPAPPPSPANPFTWPAALLQAMRPKQWFKNVFLFAGIIFAEEFTNIGLWLQVAVGFALYSLLAGTVYMLNDLIDIDRDRAHPEKCKRPIPSGQLPLPVVIAAIALLAPAALYGAWLLEPDFFWLCLFYYTENIAYSLYLKHQVIWDVLLIAIGFVLRAMGGALIIHVRISPWLLICTLFLALFLALCKRRHELLLMEEKAGTHRVVLKSYTPELVDGMISVVTAAALMAYSLYTISDSGGGAHASANLEITIPFVLFGIFRYLYLVHKKNLGGSPERIVLEDKGMITTMGLWLITVFVVLW